MSQLPKHWQVITKSSLELLLQDILVLSIKRFNYYLQLQGVRMDDFFVADREDQCPGLRYSIVQDGRGRPLEGPAANIFSIADTRLMLDLSRPETAPGIYSALV
jgi:hypothetical protein